MDKLMSSTDEAQIIDVHKFVGDLAAKQVASTPRTCEPGVDVIWVRPQQVAEGSLLWDFSIPIDCPNLIQSLYFRRKSSVNTQNFFINELE